MTPSAGPAAPFDTAAAGYDAAFTHTRLARELRARVWQRLDEVFCPGLRVLELACGTGEDARYLGSRGVEVVATDQSEAMLALARAKVAGLPVHCVPFDLKRLQPPPELLARTPYDGVLSNFGGLNTLPDLAPLARCLRGLVAPGGRLVLVIMGRWCAWEIAWHLAHGQGEQAFRRLAPEGATARVGEAAVTVYYPSTAELRRAFAPGFRLARVRPLGLLLPPSYLEPLTRRRYFPWRLFAALDRRLPAPLWADHTLYEFVRTR